MPGNKTGGRGRSAIYNWRVKSGKKEVFSDPVKMKCVHFIRENKGNFGEKLRLIPPNI